MSRSATVKINSSQATKTIIYKASAIVREKIRLIHQNLRDKTPVDTGYARDSWVIQKTGNPNNYVSSNSIVPHGNIEIITNCSYMHVLNAGWSSQAPTRFVERAIQEATNRV